MYSPSVREQSVCLASVLDRGMESVSRGPAGGRQNRSGAQKQQELCETARMGAEGWPQTLSRACEEGTGVF